MVDKANNAGCPCGNKVDEEVLFSRLDEILVEYRYKDGGLIPALQIAQGLFGYLPEQVLRHIAKGMDKPYSEVAGVVGFYSFFSTQPRGENVIRVCLGTACYVRGGKQVLDSWPSMWAKPLKIRFSPSKSPAASVLAAWLPPS
jgi:NADH:ubiquinone oxidoreductase subunit E